MKRSEKSAWLEGPGDLKEAEVEDVPVEGASVKIRALSATINNKVQTDAITTQMMGRDQVMRVDAITLDVLKFANGVIEPQFSEAEARQVSDRFGPAFQKVITEINNLSGITEEDAAAAEARFPSVGASPGGAVLGNGSADRDSGPDVRPRAGAGTRDDG